MSALHRRLIDGSNVFILKLLGGASLEGPDGPLTGRAVQKRRLALLAVLAMSRRPGLPREKLAAMLWPESDGERARHLLSDSVYVVNRALDDVVVAVGDELRLQPGRLACDAVAFEHALDRDAVDEAVRLYTGPFLDGVFVEDSDDFERWAAAERERLQGRFAEALERLATGRAAQADWRGAVDARRRLAAHDPFNSRVACQLADALRHAGDVGGAMQHLQAHVATLERELGLGVPAEVAVMLRSLRASSPPDAATAAATPAAAAPLSVAPVVAPLETGGLLLPSPARRSRGPIVAAAVTAIVAVACAVAWWRAAPVAVTALESVAVLPFTDLSPGRDHAYFADGIAEELTTRLGRVAGLRVAARTSAFTFRETGGDALAIGRALSVHGLLEGSVRQDEGRVRIAVRLVDARTGFQIWTDSWERSGRDVLALQDEIAAGVLRIVRPDLLPASAPAAVRAIDPAAYDLYLQGRYLWHQRTKDALSRAAAAFERAVVLAPGYAEAHSGIADAYAVLGFYDHLPPREAFPWAKAAAERALALAPDLAEAHASLGYVALYYDWDWAAAERALDRAVALNPSYSTGHQWRANYLVARGRFAEAEAAMRRAQDLDPLSLIASAALGWVYLHQGALDAAVQQCRRTIALNADFEQAWVWGGMAHEAAGRLPEAIEMLERAATLSRRSAPVQASLGRARAVAGDVNGARAIAGELERDHGGYLPAYELAKLHLALGEPGRAMTWLQQAHEQRSHSLVFLAVDPQLAALRGRPDFETLVAAIGSSTP